MNARLIALDLDGTLVDSAPDIAHCLGSALAAVGLQDPGEERSRGWIGDGITPLIRRALEWACVDAPAPALADRVLELFLACYADNLFVRSRLYPAVVPTLDALEARRLRLCCITNKRFAFADALLVQAGVRERFELVVGGDSTAEKKPHPLPLTTAAERLGVAPSDAVLVGDSHHDLHAARAAGFGFIWASYGYGRTLDADAAQISCIDRFADLPRVLSGG